MASRSVSHQELIRAPALRPFRNPGCLAALATQQVDDSTSQRVDLSDQLSCSPHLRRGRATCLCRVSAMYSPRGSGGRCNAARLAWFLLHRHIAFLAMKVGALACFHDCKPAGDRLDLWRFPTLRQCHARHAGLAAFRAPQLFVPVLNHVTNRHDQMPLPGGGSMPSFLLRSTASFR
jgi:hypothetical protein